MTELRRLMRRKWLFAVFLGFFASGPAWAEEAAQSSKPVGSAASPQAVTPVPQVGSQQPLPLSPPQSSAVVVPPGYALVPIAALAPASPPAESAPTRYDVHYPQVRGALPPGMELPYEPGQPIPPGYRLTKQPRRGLIIAGSLVAGIPWALGLSVAASQNMEDGTGWLVVPVLGPFMMMATGHVDDEDCDDGYCDSNGGERAILTLDALAQAAGAAMLICGITIPRKRLVRTDVTVSALPMPVRIGRDGYGLGFDGSF